MDLKDPKNILDFIKAQKFILYEYIRYIKHLMKTNYKKSAILVYWLKDYLRYIKNEKIFNPRQLIDYKHGQIVFVNFGFRVGQELGGLHYAIVLDTKNSKSNSTLTVIPLRSKKDKDTTYQRTHMVPLSTILPTLLFDKSLHMIDTVNAKVLNITNKYTSNEIKSNKILKSKLKILQKQHNDANAILTYLNNLKSESLADIGQITTISKQRIMNPVRNDDALANVIIPDNLMKILEEKIQFLYFGC